MKKETKETKIWIKLSAAKMPLNCWGQYRHVAVIESEKEPKIIKNTKKQKVLDTAYRCHFGYTEKCAVAVIVQHFLEQYKVPVSHIIGNGSERVLDW